MTTIIIVREDRTDRRLRHHSRGTQTNPVHHYSNTTFRHHSSLAISPLLKKGVEAGADKRARLKLLGVRLKKLIIMTLLYKLLGVRLDEGV